jgi:hypothetical protein
MKLKATIGPILGLLACTAGTGLATAQAPAPRLVLAADHGNYERHQAFGPGGQLVIDTNVADLAIRRGDASTLKLVIDPRDSGEGDPSSWVREFTVSKQYAKIQLDLPKHNHGGSPRVILYVPEQTSARLSLSVGNVALDALTGNVEVDIGVGNLNVGATDAAKYHDVTASVGIGNITDRAFGMGVSGLMGKDASFHGNGQWKMKLHAKIGNIEIDKGDPADHNAADH